MQIGYVTQAIGRRMLALTGLRPIEHVEGYGVEDHAHVVLAPAARRAGKALYESVPPPDDAELDETWQRYRLEGEELTAVTHKLAVVQALAPVFDADVLPLFVASSLQNGAAPGLLPQL